MILLRLFLILILFASVPLGARAEVLINEIAWMGTAASASDEWMELYNNGDVAVDLAGWTLNAVDGALTIVLQGVVLAKSFFLLERTNDASVPNIAADLIYTGALSNAGEILILRNVSGAEADRVDGSGGWTIGGNNETKETAQKISSGWITAVPTPKAANGGAGQNASLPLVNDTSSVAASDTRNFTPPFTAKIYSRGDTLIEGVEAEFRGGVEGLSADEAGKARFLWSFGDGAYQEGSVARHAYTRLGMYNISLNVILEPYSSSDYASVAVVLDNIPAASEQVRTQQAVNDSATNQGAVSVQSGPAKQAVSAVPPSNNAVPPENTAEKSLNTTNVADVGFGFRGNFWFWFLISLAVGVVGAIGFVLIKIYY